MKKIFRKICLGVVVLATFLLGSCEFFTENPDLPELGIDWTTITQTLQTNESQTTLQQLSWYADTSEIQEFGTVTFYNYNFKNLTDFKKVPYQFYIEYGCGYQLDENTNPVYYPHPVYEIMLVDNGSSAYYSCTYNEEFTLLHEEGEWFLTDDKSDYISHCLTACQGLLF